MKYLVCSLLLVLVCSVSAGSASGAECIGLSQITYAGTASEQLGRALKAALGIKPPPAACGSLESVVAKVTRQTKVGGRRLEKDRPLNPAEAQANLAAAQKNPAVQTRLEQVAKEVQDANVRMVYEAAFLDEEGFYAARDLKIQQLQQALK